MTVQTPIKNSRQLTLRDLPLYDRALLHIARHDHDRSEPLHPEEITAGGIADAIGRTRPCATSVISHLVERGWVIYDYHRVVGRQRIKTVTLTPAGRAEVARAARLVDTLGYRVEDVIRAPPTVLGDANELRQRIKKLQAQVDDLRRQIESYVEGSR
jgi:DNA-binding MarR family transcriptional regulator